jgi:hypothetical protein
MPIYVLAAYQIHKSGPCIVSRDFLRCLLIDNMLRGDKSRLSIYELIHLAHEVSGRLHSAHEAAVVVTDFSEFTT